MKIIVNMRYPKDNLYKQLIQSYRWRKFRCDYIKEHPQCEKCGKLATEVHHIKPLLQFRNDPLKMEALCFDEDNVMSVCRRCHEDLHTELGKNKYKRRARKEIAEEHKKTFWQNYFE